MQQQQATADGQVLQQTEYLYEPGRFRPMAQVTHHNQGSNQGSELHYIVTDHAGTPQELCNEQGDIVWRGEQALWGHYHGQSQRHWQRREEAANDSIQCDLRYQGQLEDSESGLYYNVNRYYDADSGQYLSPDPIGFAGGLRPQAYVANPLEWVDPLGLTPLNQGGFSVYGLFDQGATKPYYIGISNDPERRLLEHIKSGRFNEDTGQQRVLKRDLRYDEARGYEQAYIEKYGTKTGTIGENVSPTNRGNKINSFDKTRADERGKAFNQKYEDAQTDINSKKLTKCGQKNER
ncbi:RHS repeat-associated core domain-containing protein [Salinivibrio sp. MA427]|uniref:RHS repeat-associated core domain-containing protein n=1 Tax=Salinivibrio sp. MA427 TaxID=1909455 RepID=UPI001F5BB612|nr:RHS repeat-associated core domain-containing protein [Salinivibrio sp. MA427]